MNTNFDLKRYLSLFLALLIITSACKKEEITDSTDFALYYSGMTDIGPSMTGIIASPSYIGPKPSAFEIAKITIDGAEYTGSSFEIDATTGAITIKETTGIPTGLYKLTITCISNGKKYEFKDAVEVNMMQAVPEGISVEPNKLTANYADIIDNASTVVLPTAQVTTDGNHVSIKKYEIASSDYSKYFKISSTGEISIVRGDDTLMPGKYILSLKLTTGASGEDEGIFENAVEIDIISKPLALTYTPSEGKIEEESVLSGATSYTSNAPVLKGSLNELVYSIKSIVPATNKITINPQTGVLSVAENHGLTSGQQYKVSVTAKNEFEPVGVDFSDVFTLNVVEFIEPIQNFAYQNKNATQAVAFETSPNAGLIGDEVRYEFVDLPTALIGKVVLNAEGKVIAVKGNSIAIGTYTIKVKATNPKNESIATFTLTVAANPNFFTYVRYGNNLGLTPIQNYANQFRVVGSSTAPTTAPTPVTDAGVELTYELTGLNQGSTTKIDASTGTITLAAINNNQIAILMVTATAGKGTPEEYSIKTPVFIDYSKSVAAPSGESVTVEYSPFVVQVNPNTGGSSVIPTVTGVADLSKLTMDYRRSFNYFDFSGNHVSGAPSATTFAGKLWANYAASKGVATNYGSRDAVSFYGNSTNTSLPLAYVDRNTLKIVVNPNKWTNDGEAANGAFIGQITFNTAGTDPQSGSQMFPIVLWFDTKF